MTRISSLRPLNALKSIIHPPLPLTASQSQQLLDLLKITFREHLVASCSPGSADGEPSHSLVDSHLRSLLKAPIFITNFESSEASCKGEQVQIERFIRTPLEVYHELASQGMPTPDIAWATLKRHTTNMLSLPQSKLRKGWAVEAILEIIKPLRGISPRIHLEHKSLRNQIIKTLIQGGEIDIAAGMLNKPWLIHISPDHSNAKDYLVIRQSIIHEVTKSVEELQGLNTSAALFLRMVRNWQSCMERFPRRLDKANDANTNPFTTRGQYFLLRYAHQQDPDIAPLKMDIYKTCSPWVKSNVAKAKLMLYYEDNPYLLYHIVLHLANPAGRATTTTACFELILALVHHKEWDKARQVALVIRNKLIGKVPWLHKEMMDEVDTLLQSHDVNIPVLLGAMITECTKRFAQKAGYLVRMG